MSIAERDRSRTFAVPPVLPGFIILLLLLTALSYAVGRAAGPVAPGMHRTVDEPGGAGEPGMSDMHGMNAPGRFVRESL
ncbi:hypothetical protein PV723_25535 [Streptomyces sp. AK04-3B]|nr:hypothetical protein [Streptomyces sp. AK04-3B]